MAGHNLPEIYQEVEYIESSGTQYIDTGYRPSSNTNVEIGIAFTSERSGWSGIFGAQTTNNTYSYALGISDVGTAAYQRTSDTESHIDFTFNPILGQKYILGTNGRNVYVDGVDEGQTIVDTTFTCRYTARLFSVYQNAYGGFPYDVSARIYSCKVYTGATLERDFVPCYRKSDDTIGMYDLVTDTFYTNSGTGTFTKGADVIPSKKVIKKMYYMGKEYRIRTNSTPGWKPGSNTIYYLPLNSVYQTENLGRSGRTFTQTGITRGSNYAQATSRGNGIYSNQVSSYNTDYTTRTVSLWCNISSFYSTSNYASGIVGFNNYGYGDNHNLDTQQDYFRVSNGQDYTVNYNSNYLNGWHHIAFTSGGGAYVDGERLPLGPKRGSNNTINTYTVFLLMNPRDASYGTLGKVSEFIFEDRSWSATEITNYYNLTKKNYGL